MWFGRPTLKTLFEKFKKDPNYPHTEELRYEGKKREEIIRKISNEFLALGEKELAREIEDKLINKIIAINAYIEGLLHGKYSYEEAISVLEEAIDNYEHIFEEFDEKFKHHIRKIKAKLKKEYKLSKVEKSFA